MNLSAFYNREKRLFFSSYASVRPSVMQDELVRFLLVNSL